MTIPATVRICDRVYTVAVAPMFDCLGVCNNEAQEITLEQDAHPETQASVLLHEVIEAINASYGLDLAHSAINALEAGLYGVLTANQPWWEVRPK